MNYNYYFLLLENYRKKMEPNWEILSIRKAISESISNETFKARQQYRHEMAKKRREEIENQKIMNRKMKEIKEKEKEIARRYRQRNNYGQLHGTYSYGKTKPKPRELTNESSITVLLPIIKKQENPAVSESTNVLDYEVHSIPKKMLSSENEDINAYKVVKKTHELYQKYGENPQGNEGIVDRDQRDFADGGSVGIAKTFNKRNLKPLQENNDCLDNLNTKVPRQQVTRKTKNSLESQMNYMQNYRSGIGHRNYLMNSSVHNTYHHGPAYEDIVNYYRNGGGLYRDDGLSILGIARNTKQYELLIVDEGPRTEEIRVKQKAMKNPRAFDILTIKDNPPNTPNH